MQAQMLHSFPFPGLKVILWKFLPFQDLRVLCTSPLESISRAYSMSVFLCNSCIHIETNMEFSFVCFSVFGLLLFPPPPFAALFFSAVLVGKLFYRKQEFQLPRLFLKQQPDFSKNTKCNVFGSSSLSSCKLQNFPNIVYRIIAKGIRP